jgi:hypothetical protein
VILATLPGWIGGAARVDFGTPSDVSRHRIVMRRVPHIRGRVIDQHGRPLEDAAVVGYVKLTIPAEFANDEYLSMRFPEGGFRVGMKRGADTAELRVTQRCTSDENGQFELPIRESEGNVTVLVLAEGCAMWQYESGPVHGDVALGDWRVSPSADPGRRVRLSNSGVPCARVLVGVVDRSLDARPGWTLTADSEGRILADWFVPGHAYSITVLKGSADSGTGARYLHWDMRDQVDLAELAGAPGD